MAVVIVVVVVLVVIVSVVIVGAIENFIRLGLQHWVETIDENQIHTWLDPFSSRLAFDFDVNS